MLKCSFWGFTLIIKHQKRVWTTVEIEQEQRIKEINERILDRRSKALLFY